MHGDVRRNQVISNDNYLAADETGYAQKLASKLSSIENVQANYSRFARKYVRVYDYKIWTQLQIATSTWRSPALSTSSSICISTSSKGLTEQGEYNKIVLLVNTMSFIYSLAA